MSLLDQTLGFHASALSLRARRSEVLASNLANAETPGYRARDIDFAATLRDASRGEAGRGSMQRTHADHLAGSPSRVGGGVQMLYREPLQPSADGNTVEAHVEKAAFMENAAGYEASLRFLDGRISGLMKALRGDNG